MALPASQHCHSAGSRLSLRSAEFTSRFRISGNLLGICKTSPPTAPEAWGSDNLASVSADRRSTNTDSFFGCGPPR